MKIIGSIAIILWVAACDTSGVITLEFQSKQYQTMYENNAPNSKFIDIEDVWRCQVQPLFTYYQSERQYKKNTPIFIKIFEFNTSLTITTTSKYNLFTPTINQTSCPPLSNCTIAIYNNCPQVSYFYYFDIVQLFIPELPGLSQSANTTTPLSYNVICDNSQSTNSFTWGQIVLIFIATATITLTALCSKAWSWRNAGFQLKYGSVLVLSILLATGLSFIISQVKQLIDIIKYSLVFLTFTFGSFSVMFCVTQLLFLLPSFALHKGVSLKIIKIRFMDMIGMVIGIGMTLAWWYSGKNFLVSDAIDICMIITIIKLVKFTALKIPAILYICTTLIMIIFIVILTQLTKNSYPYLFQQVLTSPFLLQIPTITPVPNQKCSSLYLASLVFPGLILSYIVRFDHSRASKVYTVAFVISFISCSLIWSIISVVSPFLIPFDMITVAVALILLVFFSNRRNQVQVLWHGLFQDEEYKHNKSHLTQLMGIVKNQKSPSQLTIRDSLFKGLKATSNLSALSNYTVFSQSSSYNPSKSNESQNQSNITQNINNQSIDNNIQNIQKSNIQK